MELMLAPRSYWYLLLYTILRLSSETVFQTSYVNANCNGSDISIYAVYFPPQFSLKRNDCNDSFGQLDTKFIVGGDFNAKHRRMSTNPFAITTILFYTLIHPNLRKISDLLDFVVHFGIPANLCHIYDNDKFSPGHSSLIINNNVNNVINRKAQIVNFTNWIYNNLHLKTFAKLFWHW